MPIRSVELFESVVKTVVKKIFTFQCDIRTAWENHMSDDEKKGLSFDDFFDYLSNS